MREFIHSVRNRSITFISDRMKEIPKALHDRWQELHKHRFCAKHLKANFQTVGSETNDLQIYFIQLPVLEKLLSTTRSEKKSKLQIRVLMTGLNSD